MTTYATSSIYDSVVKYPSRVLTGGGSSRTNALRGGFFNNKNVLSSTLSLVNSRKDFLVKVFATLLVQLGITYFVMEKFPASEIAKKSTPTTKNQEKKPSNSETHIIGFVSVIQIIIILVMAFVPMPIIFKFFLFTLFSILCGISLSFIRIVVNPEIVNAALLGVGGIFASMFLLGLFLLTSGVKLGIGFGFLIWILLLLLTVTSFVFMILNKYQLHVKVFSIIGILLFSVYIMYDTNRILQKDYYGDFVTAAVDYYLDILNIFIDLIQYQYSSND